MTSMRNIASGFSFILADELGFDQKQRETVRYGLEIILATLVKGLVIIPISYILGILPYVLALFGTSMSMRMLSGGTHLSTYWRCLSFSMISSLFISYLSITLSRFTDSAGVLFIIFGLAFTGYLFVNAWSPADNPNKPINRKEKRDLYKKLSKVYVLLWSITITLIILTYWQNPLVVAICLASAGGFTLQILSISPISHQLGSLAEGYLDRLQAKGR